MATDIIMPQLGESIAEGTVMKWLIPLGGAIEKDQSLLEVETEKVDLEVPSPASGVLNEILVKEGETVAVGTLLARIDSAPPAEVISRVGGVVVRPVDSDSAGEEHHSPAVRQLAKEHGVDLAHLKGTGAGGRVTKKDVLEFVARKSASGKATAVKRGALHGRRRSSPSRQMRKTIAERMVKSRQTSAHVTTFFEADFSAIAQFRAGRDLTYLPFVIRAVTRALRDVPIVNSSWGRPRHRHQERYPYRDRDRAGRRIACSGSAACRSQGPYAVGERRSRISPNVRDPRSSAPMRCKAGTFTITNHGGFGSLFSTPIIHQPQIAHPRSGAVQKRAVVINDAIAIDRWGT